MSAKATLVIGKLLRKAETTDSAAEAEALLAKAQSLATRHAIDLAVARMAHADREEREGVEERTVVIGRPRQPHLVPRRRLFSVIADVNDVMVLVRGTDATLYPIGFPSDLDVVEAMHRSLDRQMAKEAEQWLRTSGTTLHTTQARTLFYEGFVTRIHTRLRAAREAELWAADGSEAPEIRGHAGRGGRGGRSQELTSTALALRAKKSEVDEFVRTNYPRLGSKSNRRRTVDQAGLRAHAAGRSAADRARLSGQQGLARG